MAKNKIIVLCLLFFIVGAGLFGQNTDSLRLRVIEIYSHEIGIKEATGNNDGQRVEEFLSVTGLGRGNPWCAAFVAWTFNQAGIETVRSAWSPDWFPSDKTIYTRGKAGNKTPQQADVFGILFPNLGRIAHVGFIDQWPDNSPFIITVEGNTNNDGSREGNQTCKKRRLKKQIYKASRWIN